MSGAAVALSLRAGVVARGVDLALEVAAGETLALLGPNGAGKSTVLGVAAGLLTPDTGHVRLGGRTLTDVAADGAVGVALAPHLRRTALLGQEPLLFPHLSARENVAFGPRSAGMPRARARELAERWLAEVGVGELADRRPAALSGGQAQRVAIARALAADPDLLLLDEPMAALDVEVLPALRRLLRGVLAERTVVLVTHDPLDALLLADRVAIVEAGAVVESGVTREVMRRPRSAFAARLAGLNLLAGRWSQGLVVLPDGRRVHGLLDGEAPAEGAAVVAAFRPTAVAVFVASAGEADAEAGSPRNVFAARIEEVEPHGDVVRVRAGDLAADVTVQAAADLALAPGDPVSLRVKATEVAVYAI